MKELKASANLDAAINNIDATESSHGDPTDIDPEIKTLLEELKKSGSIGISRAEQIESGIDRMHRSASQYPGCHVVVGRVVVADGLYDPSCVNAQARIIAGSYFVSAVANFTDPIGFRLHGYKPVDYLLARLKLKHHICWIGRITLDKLPEEDLATLQGTVIGDEGFDPTTALIEANPAQDPINTPGNQTYHGCGEEHITVCPDEQGRFEVTGCTPTRYFIRYRAADRVEQWQFVNVRSPMTEAEVIRLDSKQSVEISFIRCEAEELRAAVFDGEPVTRLVTAEEWFPAKDANYDLKLNQKDGRLCFYSFYYPCGLVDLGENNLRDFQTVSEPIEFFRPGDIELHHGHVYLHWQPYPRLHYTLFKVT